MIVWTKKDSLRAYKEGWCLIDEGESGNTRIQKDDGDARFETDDEAIEFIANGALALKLIYIKALAIHAGAQWEYRDAT